MCRSWPSAGKSSSFLVTAAILLGLPLLGEDVPRIGDAARDECEDRDWISSIGDPSMLNISVVSLPSLVPPLESLTVGPAIGTGGGKGASSAAAGAADGSAMLALAAPAVRVFRGSPGWRPRLSMFVLWSFLVVSFVVPV